MKRTLLVVAVCFLVVGGIAVAMVVLSIVNQPPATALLVAKDIPAETQITSVKEVIDPPPGTVPLSVRVATTPSDAGFTFPGFQVMLVATKRSEKKGKVVVIPVVYRALILSVDSACIAGERVLSFALTPEQSELIEQAVYIGATIRLQLEQCGGVPVHETDTTVFLAPAKSSEELLAFLAGE